MKKLIATALLLSSCATAPVSQEAAGEAALPDLSAFPIVDLTYSFDENTLYWPTADPFVLEKGPEGFTEGGYFYNANSFRTAEHGGTHLDAPYHFYQGRQKVSQIPLKQLVGSGLVVDVEAKCQDNPDYLVQRQDFLDWETRWGRIPDGSILLIRTGYGKRWPDAERYLGTTQRGQMAVASLHFPGLEPQAARWLATERRIKAVGIDTASIDYGQSSGYGSHIELSERNIPIFENVARMDQLPEKGFQVIALPMKIGQGSGAPLRILAVLPAEANDPG